MTPSISLLHATYHAADRALAVRETWLANAERADLVEHIFAMDADDDESITVAEGYRSVISPALGGEVTAVRNWNAAAASAKGDLLFVIADDLYPPPGWDTALRRVIGRLDPLRADFAVKIDDGDVERATLLRHPIVSRRFYVRHGLFSPRFRGVYCDDDLSTRAFREAVIIDGRELRIEHRSPSCDDLQGSFSRRRLNRPEEYEDGSAAFCASWTRRQREAPRILLRLRPTQQLSARELLAVRYRYRVMSTCRYSIDRGRAGFRKAQRLLHRPAG